MFGGGNGFGKLGIGGRLLGCEELKAGPSAIRGGVRLRGVDAAKASGFGLQGELGGSVAVLVKRKWGVRQAEILLRRFCSGR